MQNKYLNRRLLRMSIFHVFLFSFPLSLRKMIYIIRRRGVARPISLYRRKKLDSEINLSSEHLSEKLAVAPGLVTNTHASKCSFAIFHEYAVAMAGWDDLSASNIVRRIAASFFANYILRKTARKQINTR